MKIGTAKRRGAGSRGGEGEGEGEMGNGRERMREIAGDGLASARNLGLVSLKDMKSTGVRLLMVTQQIPWKVRREQRGGRDTGKEDGVRPEEGVEPGREPGVERMKGENRFLEVR